VVPTGGLLLEVSGGLLLEVSGSLLLNLFLLETSHVVRGRGILGGGVKRHVEELGQEEHPAIL
jgi:hypothetical protein